ncbi:MAG: hypothetical protein IT313_08525 [Anaerolineales bacterium]|nr:hypothetical protein [Anaerolineales bacterium]
MKSSHKSVVEFLFSRGLTRFEKLALAVLLLWGYTRALQTTPFFGDENFWIVSSARLDAFLAGDFDAQVWTEPPIVAHEVRPLPSYFVGIGQRLGGLQPRDLPSAYWMWSLTYAENAARGAMPSERALWWSRLPMAVIAALGLWSFALFLGRAHSRLAAYLFALVCFNAYLLINLRRAMSEAPILFFTILVMLACQKLTTVLQQESMNKIVLWSAVIGVLSGWAGESKLTGLACAGIGGACALIVISQSPLRVKPSKLRLALVVIFVIVYTALPTFIAAYPFFYRNTVARITETFDARRQILNFQLVDNADERISPGERLNTLYHRVFHYPVAFPSRSFAHAFNFSLALVGLIVSVWKSLGEPNAASAYRIILIAAAFSAGPMLLTPFDWERYYMFPVFFACIFFTVGAAHLLGKLAAVPAAYAP